MRTAKACFMAAVADCAMVSFENCSMHPGHCNAIDPAGMGFLAAPVGSETDWPAAFPATPTF